MIHLISCIYAHGPADFPFYLRSLHNMFLYLRSSQIFSAYAGQTYSRQMTMKECPSGQPPVKIKKDTLGQPDTMALQAKGKRMLIVILLTSSRKYKMFNGRCHTVLLVRTSYIIYLLF